MSDMKCPFCQQEYIITKDDSCSGQQRCVCRNPKCEFDGWHFPVKLVSELIRTRKALDKGMEHITGLNNMIESWLILINSDLDQEIKLHILKSAISAYVENKGGDNE